MARPKWPPRRQDCHSFPFCPDATSTAEGDQFHAVLPDECALLLQPVYQNRLPPRLQQMELVQEQIEAGAGGKGRDTGLYGKPSLSVLFHNSFAFPPYFYICLWKQLMQSTTEEQEKQVSFLLADAEKGGKMILETDPKAWIICAHVRFEKWPGAAGCISGQKCLYSPLQVMTAKIGQ